MAGCRSWVVTGLLALGALAGCSGPEVRYDYDAKADFAAFHSYDWLPAGKGGPARGGGFDNAIMTGRITRAVAAELAAKKFRHEPGAAPDLLVSAYPLTTGSHSSRVHLGVGLGFGPLGLGVGAPVGDRHREAVGSIVLEIQDAKAKTVVWKATAENVLRDSDSPAEADAAVAEAVRGLFRRFPPPAR